MPLALQNRALFEREKKGKKGPDKGRKRGSQQRAGGKKGKKGRVKTDQSTKIFPAKSKRGLEEGDGTENVINCRDFCRKLS